MTRTNTIIKQSTHQQKPIKEYEYYMTSNFEGDIYFLENFPISKLPELPYIHSKKFLDNFSLIKTNTARLTEHLKENNLDLNLQNKLFQISSLLNDKTNTVRLTLENKFNELKKEFDAIKYPTPTIEHNYEKLILISYIYSNLNLTSPTASSLQENLIEQANDLLQKHMYKVCTGIIFTDEKLIPKYQKINEITKNNYEYQQEIQTNKFLKKLSYIQIPTTLILAECAFHPLTTMLNYFLE